MHTSLTPEIKKIRGQIDDVSYRMIEAEGKEFHKLSKELDKLENKLFKLDPNEALKDGD